MGGVNSNIRYVGGSGFYLDCSEGSKVSNRDPKRLAAIRQLPCCCGCGRGAPSDAAHSNFSEHGKGRGVKADDKWTIPLNRLCHQKFDNYQMGMSKDESLVWFEAKVKFIDEVLSESGQDTAIF